jgi:hypothetical protein
MNIADHCRTCQALGIVERKQQVDSNELRIICKGDAFRHIIVTQLEHVQSISVCYGYDYPRVLWKQQVDTSEHKQVLTCLTCLQAYLPKDVVSTIVHAYLKPFILIDAFTGYNVFPKRFIPFHGDPVSLFFEYTTSVSSIIYPIVYWEDVMILLMPDNNDKYLMLPVYVQLPNQFLLLFMNGILADIVSSSQLNMFVNWKETVRKVLQKRRQKMFLQPTVFKAKDAVDAIYQYIMKYML